MAANGLILYAMVVSKQHKKYLLVFNQNALDFCSCFFLVITFIVLVCNIHFSGILGYWLCFIIASETLTWSIITGSVINLQAVTVERYLKVVHAAWSKKKLRNWMIYLAAAFSWFGGFVYSLSVSYKTTVIIDGVCHPMLVWENHVAQVAHVVWNFVSLYVIMMLLFIFGYWRILVVVRRQVRAMAGHAAAGPGTSQTQSNIILKQSNIMKTMIFVSVFFAITWMPMKLYVFLGHFNYVGFTDDGYYTVLSFTLIYICANPFIYAVKFDPVKRVLLGLIPWKKNTVEPITTVQISTPGVAAIRTAQTCN